MKAPSAAELQRRLNVAAGRDHARRDDVIAAYRSALDVRAELDDMIEAQELLEERQEKHLASVASILDQREVEIRELRAELATTTAERDNAIKREERARRRHGSEVKKITASIKALRGAPK